MIVKEFEECIMLKKLTALNRRLPNHHPKKQYIVNDLAKKNAEKKGEQAIQFPLGFLDEKLFDIFHSVRIKDENGFFQIDTLLVSRNFILIVEVKNWYGTILFESNHQVIRVGDNNKEEGFPNPITQLNLQKHRLNNWLIIHGLHKIPLYGYVVMSFPSTIIKSAYDYISIPEEIVHCNQLLFEIQRLIEANPKKCLPTNSKTKLSTLLTKLHIPLNKDIMANYEIAYDELIQGVICEKCATAPMRRGINRWVCRKCDFISTNAHFEALDDYRLLCKTRVKNRDIKSFLQLNSPYLTKNILKQIGFAYKGQNSARVYDLNTKTV